MTIHLLAIFIAYRLTSLLVMAPNAEKGPYEMLNRFRDDVIKIRFDENGNITGSELAKIFGCYRCLSLWIGWIVALVVALVHVGVTPILPFYIIGIGLAYSGATMILFKAFN